jgi:nucleoside triphosphate diphosphatase
MAALKDELGDLLFQVVYYAQMAREAGDFDFDAIAGAISDKMIRRHPHVFGNLTVDSADAMVLRWEDQKAVEREAKAVNAGQPLSVLDGITGGLPALTRAIKLQKRAARVGFDWAETPDILDKIEEEIGELRHELAEADKARLQDELGDLLFAVTNLARRLDIDPETALRGTNAKFDRRFRRIESLLADNGRTPDQSNLDEMETLWQRAKREETALSGTAAEGDEKKE